MASHPWAEAHGYHQAPLCGENQTRFTHTHNCLESENFGSLGDSSQSGADTPQSKGATWLPERPVQSRTTYCRLSQQ